MALRKQSRTWVTVTAGIIVAVFLGYAFWPEAQYVDMDRVSRSPMILAIKEEARTRVRDAYVVSAPIAGRLLRVSVEPGDEVSLGNSVIAEMLPINPSLLDSRSREQARTAVNAADAAVRMAQAELNKAMANRDLAASEQARITTLHQRGIATDTERDQARSNLLSAKAALASAKAAISLREAERANARAQLISFNEPAKPAAEVPAGGGPIPLLAPISGRVLQIMQKSETTLLAGTPIMEIGDTANDLEIIVELLSTDAVKVKPGDRVMVEQWGGSETLSATVERIEPWGFTKYSALGVEEQRVNAIIRFTDENPDRSRLGHGYRVNVSIVIWEQSDALTVASAALFRQQGNWALFSVADGRARLTPVTIGANNGEQAQILTGIDEGATIILYPGPSIVDGSRVQQRRVKTL